MTSSLAGSQPGDKEDEAEAQHLRSEAHSAEQSVPTSREDRQHCHPGTHLAHAEEKQRKETPAGRGDHCENLAMLKVAHLEARQGVGDRCRTGEDGKR